LFADGAAAALVVGADVESVACPEHVPLDLVASESVMWKDTLDVMGWDVDGDGLHVVFSRDIPSIVTERVPPSLSAFLAAHGLRADGLDHLVAHPGGVKVLNAYAEALGLAPEKFDHARAVLRDHGNMSAPTCLFVLERVLASGDLRVGDNALVTALGPGFSAEYVLLRGAAS
jgi:alkylresorcinol/alkylpyrone synthase